MGSGQHIGGVFGSQFDFSDLFVRAEGTVGLQTYRDLDSLMYISVGCMFGGRL